MRETRNITLMTIIALLLLAPAAAGQVARGEGDFEFFLDTSALPLENGRILGLFQIAIPVKEIHYKEDERIVRGRCKGRARPYARRREDPRKRSCDQGQPG